MNFFEKSRVKTTPNDDALVFRGKINFRLSIFFALVFALLISLGTLSHYLAQTMLTNTERMRKESQREVQVDRIDDTLHHFVSSLEEAALEGKAISDAERLAYLHGLKSLLEGYDQLSEVEERVSGGISNVVTQLDAISQKLTAHPGPTGISIGRRLTAQDIDGLKTAQRAIQEFNESRAEIHRARLENEFTEAQRRMRLISGLYTAFAASGAFLIIGCTIFFYHAIAKPLRRLVDHASQIAEGKLDSRVAVTSTDEIGQLSYIFNHMVARLSEHEAKLRVLAKLEERELVAQELHDSLAQDLAILRLKLSAAETDASFERDTLTKDVLVETRMSIERSYKDVRQAILGLHTLSSKTAEFIPALTEYLRHFTEMSKIPVDVRIDNPETLRFSPEVEIQLIRIIHEALTNVFKHAHATRGEVRLEPDGDLLKVSVEDDGTGLPANERDGNGLRFGLQSMRKRAEGVGGRLLIESIVGKGTRVIVHVPFEERHHGANSNPPGRRPQYL